MNYIVMDLEFNQPFDFSKNTKKTPNPEIPFEIIQIGCVKLNKNLEKIDELNVVIKPQVYKRIHPFVQKITGFTQSVLNQGQSFEDAYDKLINFVDKDSVFCVWGEVDLKLLFKNVSYYKLNSQVLPTKFINVQTLASKKLSWGSGRQIGLKNAIELFNIEIQKSFHDAFNDAIYTSLVLKELSIDSSNIDEYIIDKKQKKSEKSTQLQSEFIAIYNYVEKELGRKLSQKERKIYRNVYLLGQNKKNEKSNIDNGL